MLANVIDQLRRVRHALPVGYRRASFSQQGEDLILVRLFEGQARGFYVDVGAYHPRRFSNTLLLYQRGWRGLNIDAAPGSMRLFRWVRPRDINLEVGVTAQAEERDFYVFNDQALNTFDAVRAKSIDKPPYRIKAVKKVRCAPLSTILAEHSVGTVDLLTVDAEGYDLQVLQTLDWDKSRPRVVIAEQISVDMARLVASDVYQFMLARGYRAISKTFNSVFYVRADEPFEY